LMINSVACIHEFLSFNTEAKLSRGNHATGGPPYDARNFPRYKRGCLTYRNVPAADAFLVHTQINISTPEEFFFFNTRSSARS